MQNIISLGRVFSKKTIDTKALKRDKALEIEIQSVLKQLECTRNRFDYETESDMIDSLIFEERALLSRYGYLISLARQNNITVPVY